MKIRLFVGVMMMTAAASVAGVDPCVRTFVAPTRVVWRTEPSAGFTGRCAVEDAKALLSAKHGQVPETGFSGRHAKACRLENKGNAAGIILDFGRELHGGLQLGVRPVKSLEVICLDFRDPKWRKDFDVPVTDFRMTLPETVEAYRAYGELEAFGLIDRTPRGILFRPNAKYTFRLLLPRLKRSPYRDALITAIYGETGAHTGLSQHTGLTTV